MKKIGKETQRTLDQKNKYIKEIEDYMQTYKSRIRHLEEELAQQFYKGDEQDNRQMQFFSPLNFSKLAIGGSGGAVEEFMPEKRNTG